MINVNGVTRCTISRRNGCEGRVSGGCDFPPFGHVRPGRPFPVSLRFLLASSMASCTSVAQGREDVQKPRLRLRCCPGHRQRIPRCRHWRQGLPGYRVRHFYSFLLNEEKHEFQWIGTLIRPKRYQLGELVDWIYRVMRKDNTWGYFRYDLRYDPIFAAKVLINLRYLSLRHS